VQKDIRRRIVSVRRDGQGEVNGFELDDHTVVDYQSALQLAKHGELKGVHVHRENGREVITYEDVPQSNRQW
jgi:hypothetical protein